MPWHPDDRMPTRAAARYLYLSESYLRLLAAHGQIPAKRTNPSHRRWFGAGELSFRVGDLDAWAIARAERDAAREAHRRAKRPVRKRNPLPKPTNVVRDDGTIYGTANLAKYLGIDPRNLPTTLTIMGETALNGAYVYPVERVLKWERNHARELRWLREYLPHPAQRYRAASL